VRRWEFLFIPEALEEIQTRPGRGRRNDSVDNEGFYCQVRFVEGGAHTNVGNRVHERLAVDGNPRNVNAAFGNQFVFGLKIQCRYLHRTAASGAGNNWAFDFHPAAEEAAGAGY